MDLIDPKCMYLKTLLFVLIGACSFVLVWLEQPTARTACLLGLMVWAFSREYYFAFYVIEKYIDSGYRFSGLLSAFRYVLRHKNGGQPKS
jgi:hypothetical protein